MEFLIAYGYIGVFIASFLAATILPFSSEVVLTGVLLAEIPQTRSGKTTEGAGLDQGKRLLDGLLCFSSRYR